MKLSILLQLWEHVDQRVWLSRLIVELVGGEVQKFRLIVDNQSAIELAKNPVFHEISSVWPCRDIAQCMSHGVPENKDYRGGGVEHLKLM